ncbi:hypothetical protein D3C87_1611670 [compost metagenome]
MFSIVLDSIITEIIPEYWARKMAIEPLILEENNVISSLLPFSTTSFLSNFSNKWISIENFEVTCDFFFLTVL